MYAASAFFMRKKTDVIVSLRKLFFRSMAMPIRSTNG
jgi:hypothetical protein